MNHKRIYRLYTEEGLTLKRKRPRRHRSAAVRLVRPAASSPNERWTMDFMSDYLVHGGTLRALTILDTRTRECVGIVVRQSLRGSDVATALSAIGSVRELPKTITIDNGSEFTSRAMDHGAYRHGVQLDFIRPGKPTDNGFIESFNARFRQECLSQHWFVDLEEARSTVEAWRLDYNNHQSTRLCQSEAESSCQPPPHLQEPERPGTARDREEEEREPVRRSTRKGNRPAVDEYP